MLIVFLACISGSIVWSADAPATTPATQLPAVKVNPKDGAEMVLIPAGEFLMGTSEDQIVVMQKANPDYKSEYFSNELPQHKVYLDAYYIYKTEVTVAQYRKFCKTTKYAMPPEPPWKWQDTHPIVNVTWNDAKAYADWAGVILPSEAQWEKAARGDDGRIYPWGNDWDAGKCANRINSDGEKGHIKGTHPVGSYPAGASPNGVMDMVGNVWEWCADWYSADYFKNAPAKNPTGPKTGKFRVEKGGSWADGNNYSIRGACRYSEGPGILNYDAGFRCAMPGL